MGGLQRIQSKVGTRQKGELKIQTIKKEGSVNSYCDQFLLSGLKKKRVEEQEQQATTEKLRLSPQPQSNDHRPLTRCHQDRFIVSKKFEVEKIMGRFNRRECTLTPFSLAVDDEY
jgi:hypothetical protein